MSTNRLYSKTVLLTQLLGRMSVKFPIPFTRRVYIYISSYSNTTFDGAFSGIVASMYDYSIWIWDKDKTIRFY